MLRSLYRITPEILVVTAIFLLLVQVTGYVGGTWRIARSGLPMENFDLYSRLIASFVASLVQPAILFGMAAIVAALRARQRG